MARFDEIEIVGLAQIAAADQDSDRALPGGEFAGASRFRRLLTLLTDLSLFAALALVLSPLLPASARTIPLASLSGFVVMISFYYFVGSWMLWGKTIGGTIFDVRVVGAEQLSLTLSQASRRWAGLFFSLLTAGLGFALAALPSHLSLPDRLSQTRCVES